MDAERLVTLHQQVILVSFAEDQLRVLLKRLHTAPVALVAGTGLEAGKPTIVVLLEQQAEFVKQSSYFLLPAEDVVAGSLAVTGLASRSVLFFFAAGTHPESVSARTDGSCCPCHVAGDTAVAAVVRVFAEREPVYPGVLVSAAAGQHQVLPLAAVAGSAKFSFRQSQQSFLCFAVRGVTGGAGDCFRLASWRRSPSFLKVTSAGNYGGKAAGLVALHALSDSRIVGELFQGNLAVRRGLPFTVLLFMAGSAVLAAPVGIWPVLPVPEVFFYSRMASGTGKAVPAVRRSAENSSCVGVTGEASFTLI